jgi:hypothetical protein
MSINHPATMKSVWDDRRVTLSAISTGTHKHAAGLEGVKGRRCGRAWAYTLHQYRR